MNSVKRGDRVVLIGNESPPSGRIPAWHSEFACVGTALNSSSATIDVAWDNGYTTRFRVSKLELHLSKADQSDPNIAFLLKKRKDRHG
jgi:hypothetical protein